MGAAVALLAAALAAAVVSAPVAHAAPRALLLAVSQEKRPGPGSRAGGDAGHLHPTATGAGPAAAASLQKAPSSSPAAAGVQQQPHGPPQQPPWQAQDFLHVAITSEERLPLTVHAPCWRSLGGQEVPSVVVVGEEDEVEPVNKTLTDVARGKAAAAAKPGHRQKAADAAVSNVLVAHMEDVTGYVMRGDYRFAMAPLLAHERVGGQGYKWMLAGDDDTIWFMDGVQRLLQGWDPELPYVISDSYFNGLELGAKRGSYYAVRPSRLAPRCLPCHYRHKEPGPGEKATQTPYHINPKPGCPCTPEIACSMFDEARVPGRNASQNSELMQECRQQKGFRWHLFGGGGYIMSVGLLRQLAPRRAEYEKCLRVRAKDFGDSVLSFCLFKMGFAPTDPGPYALGERPIPAFDSYGVLNDGANALLLEGRLLQMLLNKAADTAESLVQHHGASGGAAASEHRRASMERRHALGSGGMNHHRRAGHGHGPAAGFLHRAGAGQQGQEVAAATAGCGGVHGAGADAGGAAVGAGAAGTAHDGLPAPCAVNTAAPASGGGAAPSRPGGTALHTLLSTLAGGRSLWPTHNPEAPATEPTYQILGPESDSVPNYPLDISHTLGYDPKVDPWVLRSMVSWHFKAQQHTFNGDMTRAAQAVCGVMKTRQVVMAAVGYEKQLPAWRLLAGGRQGHRM